MIKVARLGNFLAAMAVSALLLPGISNADQDGHKHEHDKPIGAAGAAQLPIFDAHIHYKEPAWGPFPPDTIIELMDNNGVAMGLVSSTPDEGTIMLLKAAPNRIVPELRPYHGDAGSSNWTRAPGMKDYLVKRLDEHPHEGIGEFHLHSIDTADKNLLKAVTEMALARDIPLHVHSGAEPVRVLFDMAPNITIIWAHAGMSEPPEVIEALMAKHTRLFADTSFRERDILIADDKLDDAWQTLLVRFSDRFMVGSDTWVNGQWEDYDGLISLNRQWLSLLPRKIAEKIAYQNAEKLFDREISLKQIGTR